MIPLLVFLMISSLLLALWLILSPDSKRAGSNDSPSESAPISDQKPVSPTLEASPTQEREEAAVSSVETSEQSEDLATTFGEPLGKSESSSSRIPAPASSNGSGSEEKEIVEPGSSMAYLAPTFDEDPNEVSDEEIEGSVLAEIDEDHEGSSGSGDISTQDLLDIQKRVDSEATNKSQEGTAAQQGDDSSHDSALVEEGSEKNSPYYFEDTKISSQEARARHVLEDAEADSFTEPGSSILVDSQISVDEPGSWIVTDTSQTEVDENPYRQSSEDSSLSPLEGSSASSLPEASDDAVEQTVSSSLEGLQEETAASDSDQQEVEDEIETLEPVSQNQDALAEIFQDPEADHEPPTPFASQLPTDEGKRKTMLLETFLALQNEDTNESDKTSQEEEPSEDSALTLAEENGEQYFNSHDPSDTAISIFTADEMEIDTGDSATSVSWDSQPKSTEELEDGILLPRPLSEELEFSLTAPGTMLPGNSYLLDAWAHIKEHRPVVLSRARRAYKQQVVPIRSKPADLDPHALALTAHLQVDGLQVEDPIDCLIWDEEIGNANFFINIPGNARRTVHSGQVSLEIAGILVARLYLGLRVGQKETAPIRLPARMKRCQRVLACYAEEDRQRVANYLGRVATAIPNWDVLHKGSDETDAAWDETFKNEIDTRDILYLFWSPAANRSKRVEQEWRTALEMRGPDFVHVVPLISPNRLAPPSELLQPSQLVQ
ncbi:Hypothetical protein PBC10988_21970 [Planctomycetales bacterium 10988]|nr:Hypothetical protein PBC10988_21970 [Planctomycetales bacterium 10988]